MMIVAFGETGGVLVEDPINMLDDLGEGIKRSFWDVHAGALREMRFQGSLLESTEKVSSSVSVAFYPGGLILLSSDDVDAVRMSSDPVVDLPGLHLGDAFYQLNRRIVREILHDDSIKITEIQEFIPL
jgi:hypothetical protein